MTKIFSPGMDRWKTVNLMNIQETNKDSKFLEIHREKKYTASI